MNRMDVMERRRGRDALGLVVLVAILALLVYVEYLGVHREPTTAYAPAGSEQTMPPTEAAKPEATAAAPAPDGAQDANTDNQNGTSVAVAEPPAPAVATPEPAAPAMPVIPEPARETAAAPVSPGVPTFDVVRVEPSGDAVIAGQAAPGAKVEILDGSAAIASADANDAGAFAIPLETPLAPGAHDLALRTTSADGAEMTLSDQRVAVSVPEKGGSDVLVVMGTPGAASKVLEAPGAKPEAATAAAPTAGNEVAMQPPATEPAAPGAPQPAPSTANDTAMTMPAPVAGTPVPIPQPPAPPEPQREVTIATVETDNGSVYVSGAATTKETVRVYIDDKPMGEAQPTDAGDWQLQATRELPAGGHTVRVDQVNEAGKVVARSLVPFEREENVEVAVLKPAGGTGVAAGGAVSGAMQTDSIIIKRGDNLWKIARKTWGSGFRWSTIYQANDDQIRNPDLIYPGQVFVLPKGDLKFDAKTVQD